MNGKNLSDALGRAEAKFITESDPSVRTIKKAFPVWVLPVAASFIILAVLSVFIMKGKLKTEKPPVATTTSAVVSVEQTTSQNDENQTATEETSGLIDETDRPYTGAGGRTENNTKDGNHKGKTDKSTTRKPTYAATTAGKTDEPTTNKTVPVEPTTSSPSHTDYKPGVLAEDKDYLAAIDPYVISKYKYPDYPLHYLIPDESNKDQNARYNEWRQAQDYKNQFANMWQGTSGFIKNSASVFLSDSEGRNTVYSPANVYFMLSLLAEATGGNSRNQIMSALNENSINDLRTRANGIWNYNYTNDGATQCLLANSIWLNKNYNYKKDALDVIADNYYAASFKGDMSSEGYVNAFRQWLNNQTGGLLNNQVSQLGFDPQTDFMLTSTILFKAKWAEPFDPKQTFKQNFTTSDNTVSVDFMHNHVSDTRLYYGDKFTSAVLYLEEGESMTFILPDEGLTPESLFGDTETLDYMLTKAKNWKKYQSCNINYSIPKFDISSNLNLIDGMKKLGITDCFDDNKADFSPICEQNEGAVSAIKHGARVMIDEYGVKAAAYSVAIKAGSAPPQCPDYDFVLDRPFIFVIKGVDGLPLFVGIVNNP